MSAKEPEWRWFSDEHFRMLCHVARHTPEAEEMLNQVAHCKTWDDISDLLSATVVVLAHENTRMRQVMAEVLDGRPWAARKEPDTPS
jgi:hypothetical protein